MKLVDFDFFEHILFQSLQFDKFLNNCFLIFIGLFGGGMRSEWRFLNQSYFIIIVLLVIGKIAKSQFIEKLFEMSLLYFCCELASFLKGLVGYNSEDNCITDENQQEEGE